MRCGSGVSCEACVRKACISDVRFLSQATLSILPVCVHGSSSRSTEASMACRSTKGAINPGTRTWRRAATACFGSGIPISTNRPWPSSTRSSTLPWLVSPLPPLRSRGGWRPKGDGWGCVGLGSGPAGRLAGVEDPGRREVSVWLRGTPPPALWAEPFPPLRAGEGGGSCPSASDTTGLGILTPPPSAARRSSGPPPPGWARRAWCPRRTGCPGVP